MDYPRRHSRVTYIARGLTTGVYKIGHTRRIEDRGQQLAWFMREPVVLLAVVADPHAEQRLHRQFARMRVTSTGLRDKIGEEYFRDADGSIAAFVATQPLDGRTFLPARYALTPRRREIVLADIARVRSAEAA